MRTNGLTRRDAAATVLVAVAVTIYGLDEAGIDLPGLSGVRTRASAVFLLGAVAFAIGGRTDAFTQRGVVLPIVSVLTVLGLATLVMGVAAIAGGGETFLTALVGCIALLWFGATARHMTTRHRGRHG